MGKKLKVVLFLILFSLSMFLFLGLKKVRVKDRVFDTGQKYYFFGAGSKRSFQAYLRPSWACNFTASSVNARIFLFFKKCSPVKDQGNSAVCCILCGFKICSFIF